MINVALVGTGYWGPNIAKSIELTGLGKLTWLCDLDLSRLESIQSRNSEAKITTNIDELLDDPALDAVCISTPVISHFQLAKKCLLAGKHVMVEKPLTSTSEQTLELWKLAISKNLKLMVGHVFEYNPVIRKIQQLLEKNELGDLQHISIERTNLGPIRTDVNALWDLATHDMSILFRLINDNPTSVIVVGESYLNPEIEDVIFANFQFPGKVLAQIHASWLNPKKVRSMTIVGSHKMLVWDDLDLMAPIKIYDKRVVGAGMEKPVNDSYLEHKTACIDEGVMIPVVDKTPPLQLECEHFLKCIKENLNPDTDGYNAFKVVRLLEYSTESLKNNGVRVDINIPAREEC